MAALKYFLFLFSDHCPFIVIENIDNTPGTAGGPGGRDRTLENHLFFLGGKKITQKTYFFLHISSRNAKILGETNFRTREIP